MQHGPISFVPSCLALWSSSVTLTTRQLAPSRVSWLNYLLILILPNNQYSINIYCTSWNYDWTLGIFSPVIHIIILLFEMAWIKQGLGRPTANRKRIPTTVLKRSRTYITSCTLNIKTRKNIQIFELWLENMSFQVYLLLLITVRTGCLMDTVLV